MKALKIIGGILITLLVICLAAYFIISPDTHMERSIVVDATPAEIYPEVDNYKNFNEWSPWATLDPETEYVYEGPERGIGAKMSWTSEHPDVGTGYQEIVGLEENEWVKSEMNFGDFSGNHSATLLLEPTDDGKTKVTWTYDAEGVTGFYRFFNPLMEDMLAPSYEEGLASFKEYIESRPEEPADDVEPEPAMSEGDSL